MIEHRIHSRKQKLENKHTPVQQRSRQRRNEILQATAALLDKVGFDDLTTTLIARELGISVGSLYHYFPHKQAILHALGEQWLEEYTIALADLAKMPLQTLGLEKWSQAAIERLGEVYEQQRGILPLVQAMYAVPELRDLDHQHDEIVVSQLAAMFERLNIAKRGQERERIAWIWLEMVHALLIAISEQAGRVARRSRQDLQALSLLLLERYSVPQ